MGFCKVGFVCIECNVGLKLISRAVHELAVSQNKTKNHKIQMNTITRLYRRVLVGPSSGGYTISTTTIVLTFYTVKPINYYITYNSLWHDDSEKIIYTIFLYLFIFSFVFCHIIILIACVFISFLSITCYENLCIKDITQYILRWHVLIFVCLWG